MIFLLNDTWLSDSVHIHVTLQIFFHGALMAEWICRKKPFWILSEDSIQKAYLEE